MPSSSQPQLPTILLTRLSRSGHGTTLCCMALLLLLAQTQIQPASATPVPAVPVESLKALQLLTRSATPAHPLSKRSVFTSQEAVGVGSAIIIVVGVGIGLGCGLIAVCGFPWRLMCAKSRLTNKQSDEDKGKEKLMTGGAGQSLMMPPPPPPPLVPGDIPGPRQSALSLARPGTAGGRGGGGDGVMMTAAGSPSSSSGPSLPISATTPVRSPLRYESYAIQTHHGQRYQHAGGASADYMVEEQFHQQGAQPRGYI